MAELDPLQLWHEALATYPIVVTRFDWSDQCGAPAQIEWNTSHSRYTTALAAVAENAWPPTWPPTGYLFTRVRGVLGVDAVVARISIGRLFTCSIISIHVHSLARRLIGDIVTPPAPVIGDIIIPPQP